MESKLKPLERPPTDDARIVDDALIQEITWRIVEGVHPRRVILFGSQARGDAVDSRYSEYEADYDEQSAMLAVAASDRICTAIRERMQE